MNYNNRKLFDRKIIEIIYYKNKLPLTAHGVMVIIVGNRHKFKSWPRLIAFHIALIPLGKV